MPDPVVAVYNSHSDAEQAVAKLSAASFDIKQISILGKDYHTQENVVGYYTTGDRMKSWGGLGAFWGGIWGLLIGAGVFLIPGIGPVLVGGPFLAALVGALESAVVVGGVSALTAGLVSLGIPKQSAIKYEAEIKADKFVLVVHGTAEEPNARTPSLLTRLRLALRNTMPHFRKRHKRSCFPIYSPTPLSVDGKANTLLRLHTAARR
jgi:hypothetical protein